MVITNQANTRALGRTDTEDVCAEERAKSKGRTQHLRAAPEFLLSSGISTA